MKNYVSIFASLLASLILHAQEPAVQSGAASTSGGADSVSTLTLIMILASAGLFIFIMIYALAKAVKALSAQLTAQK